MIGMKFAPLTIISNEDTDIESMITTFNTAATETASDILGLCEMRWENFGETTTEEGHKVFFSGKEDKHEHGV